MVRVCYEKSIPEFLEESNESIFGEINSNYRFYETIKDQKDAWKSQINILKEQLSQFDTGTIIFEYKIPRMGSFIDNVILLNGLIFIIEFKVGETKHESAAIQQLDNYVRLLENYHFESRNKLIVPIYVATEAENIEINIRKNENNIFDMIKANKDNLSEIISNITTNHKTECDLSNWSNSKYAPTPTILEAAQEIYATHEDKNIKTFSSDELFLNETEQTIEEIINETKRNKEKSIIFLTGVPGAGKTLIGLNIAAKKRINDNENAIFLSGNGTLVRVLQRALAKDCVRRGTKKYVSEAEREIFAFIQAVHHYRDYAKDHPDDQFEQIIIFDEAQRAWTQEKTESYMDDSDFAMSEPKFLINTINNQNDWGVIICLVGQDQEINQGEAGIKEWFKALENEFNNWNIYANIGSLESEELIEELNIINKDSLYLYSTIRSLNAPILSNFIEDLLKNDKENATTKLIEFNEDYPLYITRNLENAKKWIKRESQKFDETDQIRYGLLAQSKAKRLIPECIFVQRRIPEIEWFLNDENDVRSSNHLEIPATEFNIQGLEIDYSIVAWDANLRYNENEFEYWKFEGTVWKKIKEDNTLERNYLLNAYRVLLTRARRGMVIFVPEGDDEDVTRLNEYYDGTYEYLKSIGIKELEIKHRFDQ